MANRLTVYKRKYIRSHLEEWWEWAAYPFTTVDDMFLSYTEKQLRDGEYEAILSLSDFQRCAYAIGIRPLDGQFVRLPHYRPSDNSVMRFRLWQNSEVPVYE